MPLRNWDNTATGNFFRSLKTELIYGNKLITKEQMELEIFNPSFSELAKQYIEIGYNKKRRHVASKLYVLSSTHTSKIP